MNWRSLLLPFIPLALLIRLGEPDFWDGHDRPEYPDLPDTGRCAEAA